MSSPNRKLVTVVTEAALERELVREIDQLGATGYTITDARGRGSRGVRASGWQHTSNIRIEILCAEALAEAIAALLKERYYDHYAMVLWVEDVNVLRPEKFA